MTRIPSPDALRAWIAENPDATSRREIARAFGLKGAAHTELKRALRALEEEGLIPARRARGPRRPDRLPPVAVLRMEGADGDGDLFARPMDWRGDGPAPRILMVTRPGDPALGAGDRVLAKLAVVHGDDHTHEGRLIRRLEGGPRKVLGVFRTGPEGGRILPVDKGADREWRVPAGDTAGAEDGELVEAEARGPARLGLPRARVVARLGDPMAPKSVSLIAIHQYGLRHAFPDEVLAAAEAAPPLAGCVGEDLRALPFITIDPADARDHDDAVCAMADDDPANPGGHVVWVAIADVARYVHPGGALDHEARLRGNSAYFPDRVVPMLPERLSADLCSLVAGADRPVMAVRLSLGADGRKRAHHFVRGTIRSRAGLSYADVQAAADAGTEPLEVPVVGPLYAAYAAAAAARDARGPLDLDLPEREIVLSEAGEVTAVGFRARLAAHRLIEEFMVLANVAAAEELIARRSPLIFRVHDTPAPERIEGLREIARASGLAFPPGQVMQPQALNRLLAQAQGTEVDELINMATLRSMAQAVYSPENLGHFGLALGAYAHFTSPIRRYADLVVHRALIAAHGWGDDGLDAAEAARLEGTAKHISETERTAMAAERDTADRYLAAYLSERVGTVIGGRVAGVNRAGLFVRLDDTGADGLVPLRTLGAEFFRLDPDAQTVTGTETGRVIGLGDRVQVRLVEADALSGGLLLEMTEHEGSALPRAGRGPRGARRRPGPAKRPRRTATRRR
ncbi:MAG: ribonuclease R family protein [Alkalilacustris sp.]